MIRLELHVNTADDAFGKEDEDEFTCQQELNRILTEVARAIAIDGYELDGVRRIRDVNGNRCGYWVMTTAPLRNPGCGDPDCSCPECPTGRENSAEET